MGSDSCPVGQPSPLELDGRETSESEVADSDKGTSYQDRRYCGPSLDTEQVIAEFLNPESLGSVSCELGGIENTPTVEGLPRVDDPANSDEGKDSDDKEAQSDANSDSPPHADHATSRQSAVQVGDP